MKEDLLNFQDDDLDRLRGVLRGLSMLCNIPHEYGRFVALLNCVIDMIECDLRNVVYVPARNELNDAYRVVIDILWKYRRDEPFVSLS